ncbi:hypothetical protein D3C86_1546290 [compost metagenome]
MAQQRRQAQPVALHAEVRPARALAFQRGQDHAACFGRRALVRHGFLRGRAQVRGFPFRLALVGQQAHGLLHFLDQRQLLLHAGTDAVERALRRGCRGVDGAVQHVAPALDRVQ